MTTDNDDDQRVLSEASHDLANRIHRSYYFLELLSDAVGSEDEKAASLLSRLREALEDIEAIVRSTLNYIRPIELRRMRVRMDDLVASLRQHVGMRSVELGGDTGAGRCEVSVDPARISEALGVLCKAATADATGEKPLVVELLSGDPVGLRIHCQHGPGVQADIGFALTARIVRLHGGALDVTGGDQSSLTLRLPLAQQGA